MVESISMSWNWVLGGLSQIRPYYLLANAKVSQAMPYWATSNWTTASTSTYNTQAASLREDCGGSPPGLLLSLASVRAGTWSRQAVQGYNIHCLHVNWVTGNQQHQLPSDRTGVKLCQARSQHHLESVKSRAESMTSRENMGIPLIDCNFHW